MSAKKHQPRKRPVPGRQPVPIPLPQPAITGGITPAQRPFPPDRPEVIPLIRRIEEIRGSRVLAYFLEPPALMATDALPAFYDALMKMGRQPQIDLWLYSSGGATEVPYRIVQIIRAFCDRLAVLVPEMAHSAATHLALGADEIVMGPFSTLSPVDPSRVHPLLPKGTDPTNQGGPERPLPISVQDLKHAVEFIRREAGKEGLTGEALAQVISALFEKVHPLAIGAIEQSYALSKLISKRLLSMHMNEETDGAEIEKIADQLSDGYKSHQFPIGLLEARKLGLKIVEATDELHQAIWSLFSYYKSIDRAPSHLPDGVQLVGLPAGSKVLANRLAHIDSRAGRADFLALSETVQGRLEGRGGGWVGLAHSDDVGEGAASLG